MKRLGLWISLCIFIFAVRLSAQTYYPFQNQCTTGNTPAQTQGMKSTNTLMASYPRCTVTVYLHNTTTLATIYSDEIGTPLANPFTATASGGFQFFSSVGQYDIKLSGGLNGGFPSPVTLSAVTVSAPTGGGGVNPGNTNFPLGGYQSSAALINPFQVQTDSTLTRLITKLPIVDPTHSDFGTASSCANTADPSDSADSTCAINAALAYAGSLASFSNSKAAVQLPIGTFKVSAPLIVPSNVRFAGDSTGASILSISNASPVDAGISLSAVSGVEVDHINIQCASSPATCVRAVKVYNSTNVHIHDMQISGGGYASTSGPRAQIALFADDNVEIDRNQLTGSGGIYEIVSNEAGVGPVSTRLNIHDNTIQGNLAIISVGLFDAQYSRVISNKIDENNQTDSTTHDGYGIMSYSTTVQSYPLASLSGSGTITAGVSLSGGVSLLPAVGSRLFVNIAGVTGGTGTLNNGFEATVTSPTTVTYVCSGCNASGATITSATFSEPSAYNQTANNNIQNTAGSGIYFQGCMYCSTTGDILSNTVQQELATTLAAAAIAISAGNASSPIALGDTVTGPIINGSGQNGIEFTSSDGTSISGGSIRNVALNGIRIRNADTNFSIGGGITISNVLSCIQDQVSNGAGSIDGVLCSNPSFTGFNNATATPTGPRSISNFSCIGTTAIPCVFDTATNTQLSAIKATGMNFDLRGTGTKGNDLEVDSTATGSAFSIGGSHMHLTDLRATSVNNVLSFAFNTGVEPSDILIDGVKARGMTGLGYADGTPVSLTGNTTSGSNVISNLSTTSGFIPGMIITDFGSGNLIPVNSVIQSVNSGTGCSSACVVINNNATGNSTGEAMNVFSVVPSSIKVYNADFQGTLVAGQQCTLIQSTQNSIFRNITCSGISSSGTNVFDVRGTASNLELANSTLSSGNNVLTVIQNANAIYAHDNTITGAATFGVLDSTSNPNNQYIRNMVTGNGNVAQMSVSNPNAYDFYNIVGKGSGSPNASLCPATGTFRKYLQVNAGARTEWTCFNAVWSSQSSAITAPTKFSQSLTPAAVTASTCAEQTFTVTGLAVGQWVNATPPSVLSHVWIQSARVSAANTLALGFCADATGGTPPTGTWIVLAE